MRITILSAVLALLTVGFPGTAHADGEITTNYACLADGDADQQAHYRELDLLKGFQAHAGSLDPNYAVLVLGRELLKVTPPAVSDDNHATYHKSAREMAQTLLVAGSSGDPEQARKASEAYFTWRKLADAQHLACPQPKAAAPVADAGSGSSSGGSGSGTATRPTSPTRSASTVLRHAEAHRGDPEALIADLRKPASQRVLKDADKLEESGRLVVDSVIAAEHARLTALKAEGKSSHRDYDAALANLDAAAQYAADCGIAHYRQDELVRYRAAIYTAKGRL